MARLTAFNSATKTSAFLATVLVLWSGGFGCSLTATRPIQEMSNAEAALKAAKDLQADSLVPEIYRSAHDYYFKAKRDYRLKNFDSSKKNALRATRLAEQAEFEAYRMGGAAPEASGKYTTPEGGLPDPESEFKASTPTGEPTLTSTPQPTELSPPPSGAEKGKDYGEVLREQEEEKKRAEEDAKKAEKDKDKGGPTGPGQPQGQTGPDGKKVEAKVAFPENAAPRTGGLPPSTAGTPQGLSTGESQPTLTPNKGADPYWQQLEDAGKAKTHGIPKFEAKPLGDMGSDTKEDSAGTRTGPLKDLGKDAIAEKQGLDDVDAKPMPGLDERTKAMPALFDKTSLDKGKDEEESSEE